MLKGKIHRLHVTEAKIHYEGSITIDEELVNAADILPGEKVHVVNINNGARFETYVIKGKAGSGVVCVNGAAARLAVPGDIIIVIAYGLMDEKESQNIKPKIVFVDEKNQMIKKGKN